MSNTLQAMHASSCWVLGPGSFGFQLGVADAANQWALPFKLRTLNGVSHFRVPENQPPVLTAAVVPVPGAAPFLATGAFDGTVQLGQPFVGDEHNLYPVAEFSGHEGSVYALTSVELPTGEAMLASASVDGTVRLWQPDVKGDHAAAERTDEPDLVGEDVAVLAMAITRLSSGGSRNLIATANLDQRVRLWDPETGHCTLTLAGQAGSQVWLTDAMALAVPGSPSDDAFCLAIGSGHTVSTWGIRDAELISVHTPLRRSVWLPAKWRRERLGDRLVSKRRWRFVPVRALATLTTSKGRRYLAVAGGVRIRLWNVQTGRRAWRTIHCESTVHAMIAVPLGDATLLATGHDDGTVWLWNPSSRKAIGEGPIVRAERAVTTLALVSTPQGPILVSGADDGTLAFADPVPGAAISEPELAHADGVGALTEVTIADRGLLASGGADGRVCLWDPVEQSLVAWVPIGMEVTGFVYDQGQLFVGSRSGLICRDVARIISA